MACDYKFLEYPTIDFRGERYYAQGCGKDTVFDVVLVCGDAYVDHPAFAAAVIFRLLESLGLKVAVIAQPDVQKDDDLTAFGQPRLFFGVVPGAMDSMVANYTAAKMPRSRDRLSPGGRTGLRPKRALNIYVQRLRQLFKGCSIVIGGIEASLRRFVHYDFWEDKLRDPALIDAPADMLIYGMGEAAFEPVVRWYQKKADKGDDFSKTAGKALEGTDVPQIPQTCIRLKHGLYSSVLKDWQLLPSVAECKQSKTQFMKLSKVIDTSVRPDCKILVQEHPKGDIVCFPPTEESFNEETEIMGKLRFNRRSHPIYKEPIPGLLPVQFSVQSHRGCLSACSFCALSLHQGRIIRSRSIESIIKEIKSFVHHPDFHGVIPDIGGPSVNMYGWYCARGGCSARMCLHPQICPNLRHSLRPFVELLKAASAVPGVKHVMIGSGIRYDVIRQDEWDLFEYIIDNHVSGQLKVAPEHFDKKVLHYMRKGENADFSDFAHRFYESCRKKGKKMFIVPYLMTAFPGSSDGDQLLAEKIRELHLVHQQIQEFTPTPGSMGSAMYYTETDWENKPVHVAKTKAERMKGREKIQGSQSELHNESDKARKNVVSPNKFSNDRAVKGFSGSKNKESFNKNKAAHNGKQGNYENRKKSFRGRKALH